MDMKSIDDMRAHRRFVENNPGSSPKFDYLNETFNDRWVVEYALPEKRNGFFVEAGASNGIQGSSCYHLEHNLNWTGITIEPNNNFFKQLKKNRPKSIHEPVCLSDRNETVTFAHPQNYGAAAPYLGGVKQNLKRYKWDGDEVIKDCVEEEITAVPLEFLLEKWGAPSIIDYAAFDIEGSEYLAIKSFPFDTYKFLCMSFESDDWVWEKIYKILSLHGYSEVRNPFTDKPWEHYCLHKSII